MPEPYSIPSADNACWIRLRETLTATAARGPIAIAFSGGLDSRFLAHAARLAGLDPLLVHVSGPHITPSESAWAKRWAHSQGLRLVELELDPLASPAVASGAEDRCYHCKHALFGAMLRHLEPNATLCDGSNISDLNMYRPGLRAVRELGIRSPLAESGLDKARIHELAGITGMDRPGQKPRPCLLTRFAYGLRPTRELLTRLAEAEEAVAALLRPPNPDGVSDADHEDAVPDFRLRLPYLHRLELHCAHSLSPVLQERIRETVAACGLPEPEIIHLQTVSGYFDAQTQTDTARGSS